jgi:hypothetical protein
MILVAHLDINVEIFSRANRNLGSDRNGLNVGYRKERIAVKMVWRRANIAEDANRVTRPSNAIEPEPEKPWIGLAGA